MGGGGNAGGSDATRPMTFACSCGTPVHRRQADPARRAARGPSTGSGAAVLHIQHEGNRYRELRIVRRQESGQSASREARVRAKEFFPLSRRRHVSAAEMPIYQARLANRFR